MNFHPHSKPKILIIPHVDKIGGAGIYISDFVSVVKDRFAVSFGGQYGNAYQNNNLVDLDESVTQLVFPIYAGVSYRAMAYRLLKNVFLKKQRDASIRQQSEILKSFDFIVLTSSIQVALINCLKNVAPESKIILFAQENVRLNLFFLSKYFLSSASKAAVVISITSSWSALAKLKGLSTSLVRNTYLLNASCVSAAPQFDVLYVGGGSGLKGFKIICDAIKSIGKNRALNICMAGHYSHKDLSLLARLNEILLIKNGSLMVVGFQSDLSPFYEKCKFLVLPITKPHFCRPAIEAASHQKTFIAPNFSGLEDFALNEKNCFTYDPKSQLDFERVLLKLLDDPIKCIELGKENSLMIATQFGNKTHREQINNIMDNLLDHQNL